MPTSECGLYFLAEELPDVQDEVLIAGFGRRGHAVGDIPGVRFKVQLLSLQGACILFGVHARMTWPGHTPASVPFAVDAFKTESCMPACALQSFVLCSAV